MAAPPIRVGDVYKLGRVSPLCGLLAAVASLPDSSGRLTAFVRLFGGEQLIHLNAADLEDVAE